MRVPTEAVWLNGTVQPRDTARLDPLAQGFLFGLGIYDSLLLHRGVPVALDQHLSRLTEGAARLGLRAPEAGEMKDAIAAVSAANGLSEARIRITLGAGAWSGTQPPAEAPQICLVTAAPVPLIKPAVSVITVPWRRNDRSPLAGVKFTACAENILAQRAALAADRDEAIFLNSRLELCEGAFSNIFLVHGDSVSTPPLSSGCLPGVTRAIVIELCRRHGIPCHERDLNGAALFDSESLAGCEAFLTSSIRGIQPIDRFDERRLKAPGDVTRLLQAHYAAWLESEISPA